jgi:tryptophan synthase alpha chain
MLLKSVPSCGVLTVATADLAATFAARASEGRKLLVPYLMAGMVDDWLDVVEAVVAAGADAVEIGLPFSDPILDGVTIQEAGMASLARGTTATSAFAALAGRKIGVPLVAMTYYNVVAHMGHERFAGLAEKAGVSGAILPDLSLEELGDWPEVAGAHGIAPVLLVAPSTPPARTKEICARSRGFVYAVARMGVTGERTALSDDVAGVVEKIRACPSPPVLVGVGVSTPEQAYDVSRMADGVIVGSALVRHVLDGGGPEGAGAFVAALRRAIDA